MHTSNPPLREVMESSVVMLNHDASLLEASWLFEEHHTDAILIVDEGQLSGLLNLSELLFYMVNHRDWASQKIGQVASQDFIYFHENDQWDAVSEIIKNTTTLGAPVVDKNLYPIGWISRKQVVVSSKSDQESIPGQSAYFFQNVAISAN